MGLSSPCIGNLLLTLVENFKKEKKEKKKEAPVEKGILIA